MSHASRFDAFIPGLLKRVAARTIVAAAAALLGNASLAQGPGAPPSPVVVSLTEKRVIAATQAFVGAVRPLRGNTIGTAVDGRVVELLVHEGDFVEEGQILARLRTETAEIDLAKTKAELSLSEAELAELVAGTRPQELAEAEARVQSAESRYRYESDRFERARTLRTRNSLTEEQFDEMRVLKDEAAANLDVVKEKYLMAREGPRREKVLAAAASVEARREAVRLAEDRLSKFTIRASFSGYVTVRWTEVGHWLKIGDPVADMVDLALVKVQAGVPEDYVENVVLGMEVPVRVAALPGRIFLGKVAHVVPLADSRSRSFPVHIQIANTPGRNGPLLKAGFIAHAMLPTGATIEAVVAPKDALVLGGASPVVYVVDTDPKMPKTGTVRPVPVETGAAVEDLVEVRGEIAAGTLVVVRGNERLRPGQPVLIQDVLPASRTKAATVSEDRPSNGIPAPADKPSGASPIESKPTADSPRTVQP